MSAEPDTRPFTSAELARFLEQLELDRPAPRASRIEAHSPRVATREPATRIGLGTLVPFAAPPRRLAPSATQVESSAVTRPAVLAQRAALVSAAPAPPRQVAPPRPIPVPPRAHGPRAAWSRTMRWRVLLVLSALVLLAALLVLGGAMLGAQPATSHARGPLAGPPPLPPLPRSSRAATEPALADLDAAGRAAGALVGEPESRGSKRREAVELLLAGRTRAALAVYRSLPRAQLAQPELALVIRLLERELRECSERAGPPCAD